jgi:hypothetical protein
MKQNTRRFYRHYGFLYGLPFSRLILLRQDNQFCLTDCCTLEVSMNFDATYLSLTSSLYYCDGMPVNRADVGWSRNHILLHGKLSRVLHSSNTRTLSYRNRIFLWFQLLDKRIFL